MFVDRFSLLPPYASTLHRKEENTDTNELVDSERLSEDSSLWHSSSRSPMSRSPSKLRATRLVEIRLEPQLPRHVSSRRTRTNSRPSPTFRTKSSKRKFSLLDPEPVEESSRLSWQSRDTRSSLWTRECTFLPSNCRVRLSLHFDPVELLLILL